ncbi:MAG: hypothetical protein HY689_08520 [Chloroflexi bacterium]|nr:hypothetical protein [Chloroflexota bacterium]
MAVRALHRWGDNLPADFEVRVPAGNSWPTARTISASPAVVSESLYDRYQRLWPQAAQERLGSRA